MKKNQILIFDDRYERAEGWADELNGIDYIERDFYIVPMTIDDFRCTIKELLKRRYETNGKGSYEADEMELDETTIFMIDARLISKEESIHTSGSLIAYLARCFSDCLYFIGINQFEGISSSGKNTFDLTMKGHPEFFYDLLLEEDQLINKGLWDQDFEGFRPWYWPILSQSVENFERRIADVSSNIDESISEFFGFSDEIKYFPDSVNNFLGGDPTTGDPTTITFREFALTSENGINIQDNRLPEENIARVAAARISTWLEHVVLQRQDILIDAPHLVTRYPSLLIGDDESIDVWNSTAKFTRARELNLDHSQIGGYQFERDYWLSRPAWFWGPLSEDEEIIEVANPWKKNEVNLCFSEDSSKFLPKEICNRFESDFDSMYKRRYIKKERYTDVEYRPRLKLLNLT